MLKTLALGLRRYAPVSRRSPDHSSGELGASSPQVENVGHEEAARVQGLVASVAALQQQCQDILKELRAVNDRVAQLTMRESQLRAVLRRDAELDVDAERLQKIIGKTDIGKHVANAIDRAELHVDPFPYAVVDDLLPRHFYKVLLKALPPVELFADRPVNKQQLSVPLTLGPTYVRQVWRFMTDVVVPDFITPSVLEKFRQPLADWISANWPDVDSQSVQMHSSQGRIMLRRRGYRIPPHRDPKWGFITCLFYLARPDDSEAWGTQVYAVDSDQEARGAAPHWIDPAQCRLVHDIPFVANRTFIFLNSYGAHGSQIPDDAEPAALERYAYQFRIGPTTQAVEAMMATLSEERRPMWTGKFGDY
jgi:hypothetical protein